MNAPLVDDKWWNRVSCSAIALDDCNPLSIAGLDKLWLSASLYTGNDLYRPNNAYLESTLVKVVHVVVLDAVLGLYVGHKSKPITYYLMIFLETSDGLLLD